MKGCKYIYRIIVFIAILGITASVPGTSAVSSASVNKKLLTLKTGFNKKNIKKYYKKNILIKESTKLTLKKIPPEYTVSYRSSNNSILRVKKTKNGQCRYTGISSGNAHIVVKIKSSQGLFFLNNNITLKIKIRVSPRAVSVKFRRSEYILHTGETLTLSTTTRPSISKEVPVYTISDKAIADVDEQGVITGKKPGTATVYATLLNGMQAKAKIIVEDVSDIPGTEPDYNNQNN